MTSLDQPDLGAPAPEHFSQPSTAVGETLPAALVQRVREDLGTLCRDAHDDALERLAEEGRALCPSRAVQLAVYRSLRWFRSGEPLLRARFAANLGAVAPAATADALGLLDEEDLREGLAQATFVAQAHGTAGAPFAVLAGALREAGVGEAGAAMLAPRALLQAYAQALDAFALDAETRLELLRAMQARLLAALPACYRDWQRVVRGEAAAIADGSMSDEAPARAGAHARITALSPPSATVWPRAMLLLVLDGLQSARRGKGRMAGGGADARAAAASDDAPEPASLAGTLAAALTAREAGAAARFAEADRAAIELVDILFAMLVADAGFPASLASDFLALRLPFLRLCLQDRAHVLARAGAPRRLLETLVRGVLGADPAQPRGRHALACARAAIDALLARCDGDAAVCARVRVQFENALAALPAGTAREEDDVPRVRLLAAWQAVAVAVGRELARSDLPPLVHALLRRPWAQSMVRVALRHGEDSPEFRHAAGIAAALCAAFADWSTRPSLQPQYSQRAMHGLAAIAIDLRAGLERAGYGAFEVVELWQQLSRLIVQPARDDAPETRLPMLSAGLDVDAALRDLAPPPAAPAAAPVPIAALRVGQIVEWRAPERAPQRLKLCWRSSTSGWHVFVNAAGVKTLELPAARVARMLADGLLEARDTP